jgi:16S rRNA (guanine966-N2)-methyltransferase
MRVVAGELKGRQIQAPEGTSTRPTTDRVREALFNALGSLDVVVDATVVDLFAGSGALGIEALSRGASHCTFVERDASALRVLRENVAALGLTDRSRVVPADATVAVGSLPPIDLVLADPPYDFADWAALLGPLEARLVVLESSRSIDLPDGWELVREKRYGRTYVAFAERTERVP